MKMMGNSPKQPMGKLSVLERALAKKQKPMKDSQAGFAKGTGINGVKQ